jgi:SAM-dependent methyltransferase
VSVFPALLDRAGRSFARFVTNAVMRVPRLWPLLRGPLRVQFDKLAPRWDERLSDVHMAPYEAALGAVHPAPRRALDLGTGTGAGAFAIATHFPHAEVVAEARRKTPEALAGRVRFERADAARLPYRDGEFELVALANMIPFFDELARITASGGHVLLSFSSGPETPIYVPLERIRTELERRGFAEFARFAAGNGTAVLARKPAAS